MKTHDLYTDGELRRTFAIAISNDPQELYRKANIPRDEMRFSDRIVRFLEPQFENQLTTGFLREGLNDVQRVLHSSFEENGDISHDEALVLVENPNTIQTIAELSLRSQIDLIKEACVPKHRGSFYISDDHQRLLVGPNLPDQSSIAAGCPFAGKGTAVERERKIDPLFKRFVPWAGTLAVLRYFEYEKNSARNLQALPV